MYPLLKLASTKKEKRNLDIGASQQQLVITDKNQSLYKAVLKNSADSKTFEASLLVNSKTNVARLMLSSEAGLSMTQVTLQSLNHNIGSMTPTITLLPSTYKDKDIILIPEQTRQIRVGMFGIIAIANGQNYIGTFLPIASKTTSTDCKRAKPFVVARPSSQVGVVGQTLSYQLSITNRDSSSCGESSFEIFSDTHFFSLDPSETSFNIFPQKTNTVTLRVTSNASLSPVPTSYTILLFILHAQQEGSAHYTTQPISYIIK